MMIPRFYLWLLVLLIALGVGLPVGLYWLAVGRARGVSPEEAHELLAEGRAVLIEVEASPTLPRPPALAEAIRYPLASLLKVQGPGDLPTVFQHHRLLLLCPGGIHSAQAAIHLQRVGVDAASVRGGLQDYIAAAPNLPRVAHFRPVPELEAEIPAYRPSPVYEQVVAVGTFFGIKFLYTLGAAAIVVALWRRGEADLAATRRAMAAFFVGEMACFVNVMAFADRSVALEHLHSVGMVFSLAWATYAVLEALDRRIIHYSDAGRCAYTELCRGCIKHADVACGLRRVFLVLIPATALLAAVPLGSSFRDATINTRIFGVLHSYRHPVIHQIYELRYLPIAALVVLAACFVVLLLVEKHPTPWSRILFSIAAGAVGFSYFRLILVASFVDNQVWFAAWEETTELLYVGLVGGLLLIFHRALFRPAASSF